MKTRHRAAPAAILAVLLLGACATQGPIGAVVPMTGGVHQSVVNAPDRSGALRSFDNDAKLTCGSSSPLPGMARPGRYVVVSQSGKEKTAKEIQAENKNVQAGIAVGLRYLGLEERDSYELTTVFRCE